MLYINDSANSGIFSKSLYTHSRIHITRITRIRINMYTCLEQQQQSQFSQTAVFHDNYPNQTSIRDIHFWLFRFYPVRIFTVHLSVSLFFLHRGWLFVVAVSRAWQATETSMTSKRSCVVMSFAKLNPTRKMRSTRGRPKYTWIAFNT